MTFLCFTNPSRIGPAMETVPTPTRSHRPPMRQVSPSASVTTPIVVVVVVVVVIVRLVTKLPELDAISHRAVLVCFKKNGAREGNYFLSIRKSSYLILNGD